MASTIPSTVRPSLRDLRAPSSSSPHTPSRFISSNYSSPGSTYRPEDDAVVIELGSRYLRAGFEGESSPQCVIAFGPEHNRRVGDYSIWGESPERPFDQTAGWGADYELWRNDLEDVDLPLMEAKLERMVRETYNKYLLTDAGNARLVLVIPSLLSHPVLSSVLYLFFERWNYPTITLLPSPTMAAVGAGLRSALIIDIGWEETVVTPIYEYRELSSLRSTRAMKMMTRRVMEMLQDLRIQCRSEDKLLSPVTFEFAEEVTMRTAVCGQEPISQTHEHLVEAPQDIKIAVDNEPVPRRSSAASFDIEWPTVRSSVPVPCPVSHMLKCVESVFINDDIVSSNELDDHEWLLPNQIYKTLLSLSPDVRAICMARLTFVGGGSHIPGLTPRILREVRRLVDRYGWNAFQVKSAHKQRSQLAELSQGQAVPTPSFRHGDSLPPGKDFVEDQLQKQQGKSMQTNKQGELRQVESLGSWAGASLFASLKIKGVVEIERERYLSHGFAGAHRDIDPGPALQKMNSFAAATGRGGEKTSWTLAGWG